MLLKRIHRPLLCLAIALFGSLVVSGVVFAKSILTPEELQIYSANNIVFYEPCTGGSSTPGNSCISEVSGSTIEEKIWSGLTAFLTEEQAAGVMGNMAHEGGFNPARHETTFIDSNPNFPISTNTSTSYGIGLIQWSFGRRVNLYNHLKENGAENLWTKYIDEGRSTYGRLGGADFLAKADESEANALIAQELCFLKSELDNNKSYGGIYDTKTVAEASDYFLEHVEIPANIPGQRPIRRADAQKYYDQFHGKTISGGGGMSGGSDPACNGNAKGSKNINAAAVALAWPLGTPREDYDQFKGGKPTPLAEEAWKDTGLYDRWKSSGSPWREGAFCSGFAALAAQWSGVDPTFSAAQPGQLSYVKKHLDIWEIIKWDGKKESLEGGDILDSEDHHTWMVVEDQNGEMYIAEASMTNRLFGHITKYSNPGYPNTYIFRAKNARNSNVGVSVTDGVSTSSVSGKVSSDGAKQGNGNISATAVALAWPKGTPHSKYYDANRDGAERYPAYAEAVKKLGLTGHGYTVTPDCGDFVKAVVKYSGYDPDFDYERHDNTDDLWEIIEWDGDASKLKAGDVLELHGAGSGTGFHGLVVVDIDGELYEAEAGYGGRVWGHIGSKATGGYKSWSDRKIWRPKKQSDGSGCNVCGDEDSSETGLKEGGMTKAEAEVFMQQYATEAKKKKTGSYSFQGAFINDAGCPNGTLNNCVAFSQWFVNRFTSVGPKGAATDLGVGMAKTLGSKNGLETGSEPRPYAIFSKSGPTSDGHTGVILGVDKQRQKVITGEAACNESSGKFTVPWVGEYSFSEIKGWNYAYTDKVLKSGGGLTET